MAQTVPETIKRSATTGERILFNTLKNYLPDDYLVYYEPEIHGRRPDFVIIGPDLGLIVLEVKDWTLNTIVQATKDEWVIFGKNQQQAFEKNPYKKAEEFTFHIMDHLKQDSNLIQADGKKQHHLKFPCGFGAVFSRLNTDQLTRESLYNVISPQFCLARNEIDPDHEDFSEEVLIEKLVNMFKVNFRLREPLSPEDVNAIRHNLLPEVRISAEYKEPVPHQDQILLSMHNLKTMDIHQENYAKNIGDKNRLIRGVAGSGKTLILATRAALLARENPDWNILILCYNISLARYLRQLIDVKVEEINQEGHQESLFEEEENEEKQGKIDIYNFHALLKQKLKIHENQLSALIESLKSNNQLIEKYDAILIDEGQDFEQEWLQLVSHLLNPSTQSLLLVEDRAQEIYKRKRTYVQDVGLNFRGRSKILSINYRNTQQIVRFAWEFYQRNSILKDKVVEQGFEGEIIAPKTTPRKGPEPFIYKANNFMDEMKTVSQIIQKLHDKHKVPYDEMVILYRVKRVSSKHDYIGTIQRTLRQQDIPHYWISQNPDSKRSYVKNDNQVKISTIESSKGLDFQAVFIVNVDNMPFFMEEDENREAALLYIAMTRAHKYLSLTYSGESKFTKFLNEFYKNMTNKIKSDSV
ncbi:DEAD/DEAH box helicase [Tenuibacillus multivorans]|uniref:Superfamily I DNA and RNA helicases n=1 Tax=Tenuibacillus multivorans TaxID=237069 RepID=A0A1G9WJH6_9BACI|nr:nuclease-related domain-containing DEAD/DEAH box helicase [Tenuibacillus multivorans]GEL76490.1 DNA helicase [Tenuibacillus multivorans]SDM84640.1 Superfamily I DNA and RNA helicases [Tenuibacillus multivorans]